VHSVCSSMLCACSWTALCLTSLSLARLLALRLPDGSRLKKPSPCLWKIEDFLCLRIGGAHGPYTRGLTTFVCACNRVRAFLAYALIHFFHLHTHAILGPRASTNLRTCVVSVCTPYAHTVDPCTSATLRECAHSLCCDINAD
jgi:hypothetical protein